MSENMLKHDVKIRVCTKIIEKHILLCTIQDVYPQ